MEIYIRASNKSVSEAQFRAAHANISLPDMLTAEVLDGHGADQVFDAPAPAVTAFQSPARDGTVIVNGRRVTAWVVQSWGQGQIDSAKAAGKTAAWEVIKDRRTACEGGGVLVNGHWFHTDQDSRIKIMGLVMLGANIPANLQWKTMDKTQGGAPIFASMTHDLANLVFLSIANLDTLAFAQAEVHRAAMEQSANPAAYDTSPGWPSTFAG